MQHHNIIVVWLYTVGRVCQYSRWRESWPCQHAGRTNLEITMNSAVAVSHARASCFKLYWRFSFFNDQIPPFTFINIAPVNMHMWNHKIIKPIFRKGHCVSKRFNIFGIEFVRGQPHSLFCHTGLLLKRAWQIAVTSSWAEMINDNELLIPFVTCAMHWLIYLIT